MLSTIPDVSILSTCEWVNIPSTNVRPFRNPYSSTRPPWFSPPLGPLLLKITKLGWLSWSERRPHARVCHCISWRSWVQFSYRAFFFGVIILAQQSQHRVTSSPLGQTNNITWHVAKWIDNVYPVSNNLGVAPHIDMHLASFNHIMCPHWFL